MPLLFSGTWEHALLAVTAREAAKSGEAGYLGRTALQKIVYFLQIAGVPMRYAFDIYHYGPYCDRVSRDVELLLADGVLKDASTYAREVLELPPRRRGGRTDRVARLGPPAALGDDQQGRPEPVAARPEPSRTAGDARLPVPPVKGGRRERTLEGSRDRPVHGSEEGQVPVDEVRDAYDSMVRAGLAEA